ncbi:hypothetical protein ELI_0399 [Eubacterium callanderi]|uniref:Uncharacterized protein n=1 Tax=Eubacterium callanderi TaxID=53442 RepID=E3GID1_9FIRM|nr:hypothetical protein ELI_0399 [Eubacterium callanderi]
MLKTNTNKGLKSVPPLIKSFLFIVMSFRYFNLFVIHDNLSSIA